MQYLDASEYVAFGLGTDTSDGLIAAASALIDSFCRRPSLGVTEYVERLRVGRAQRVQLSYGPLAAPGAGGSPLVLLQVRRHQRGWCSESPLANECALFFSGPAWVAMDPSAVDLSPAGVLELPPSLMGLPAVEMKVTYTAGFAEVPLAVKVACAQIVRNAQSTPALTVRGSEIDRVRMEYFSGTLLDADVQRLLQPFVAERVG